MLVAIAIPVDPRKSITAKRVYWFFGPMLVSAFFAFGTYGSVRDPGISDVFGIFLAAVIFAYIGFGGIYLRKAWPISR